MKVNLTEMYIDEEMKNAAVKVLESGRYVKGPEAKNFEEEFSRFCEVKWGVSTNSGTSAIHIALISIGVGKGDEVIVPSHTFISTATSVLHVGAKPVFADIDPSTYTIDPKDIRRKITKKTKAIIPVHLYGHPCEMDKIIEIADENGLKIIEDACQAHGAEYRGKRVGGFGEVACFSMFPSKNMTVAGDGGMLVTDNKEYAEKSKALRDQGRKKGKKYEHHYIGFNFRMSEILAAIGRVQLKHLKKWVDMRRKNAERYNELLKDIPGITIPLEKEWVKHAYHLYVIRSDKRDELQTYLKEKNISTGIHYPIPVHLQPCMNKYKPIKSLNVTEKVAKEVLSLPMHPQLKNSGIKYVVSKIREFMKEYR